jgi:hypothetical protein
VCAGDFNEILDNSEKVRGRQRPNYLMENFRSTLEVCGLYEIYSKGPMWTWNNGRGGEDFTMERLNRTVANHAWMIRFTKVEASFEIAIFSDHLHLFINTDGQPMQRRKGRGFRYEAKWAENKEYKEVIKKIWRVKTPCNGTWKSVRSKLKDSKGGLLEWQRVHGRKGYQEIHKISEKLLRVQAMNDGSDLSSLKKIKDELAVKQKEEDVFWQQRARENWLRHGDKNTKYFQACMNQKKKANIIGAVTDVTRQKRESQEEIGEAFARYFQDLFNIDGPRNMENALEGLKVRVTPAMNEALLQEFTIEKVGWALAQMDPLKAPSSNGFSICFFQKNWATFGGEVSQFVTRILNNDSMNK